MPEPSLPLCPSHPLLYTLQVAPSHFDKRFITPCQAILHIYFDGYQRLCFPRICSWIADYFENVNLHSIKSGFCAVCEEHPDTFGTFQSRQPVFRDYKEYFERLIDSTDASLDSTTQAEALSSLKRAGVRTTEGVFWALNCITLPTAITPDILHTIYLGLLDHLMK